MSDPLCFCLFSSSPPQVLMVGLVLVELDLDLFLSLLEVLGLLKVKFSLSLLWLLMLGLCFLLYVLRNNLSRWILSVLSFIVGF